MYTRLLFPLLIIILQVLAPHAHSRDPEVQIHGFGWVQAGRIVHSSDTADYNYNGNWIQSAAAQVTAHVIIDEYWDGALGVGAGQEHLMQGRVSSARELSIDIASYISQARFSFSAFGRSETNPLQITVGYFPYNYNPDIKNLGLYLLRGAVYPGILISGFETKETQPIANMLGFKLHSTLGSLRQDLILTSETEIKPLFDYSLAYICQYSLGEGLLDIGAGINFYKLIPVTAELTTPDDTVLHPEEYLSIQHPYDVYYREEGVQYTHKGIKTVGFFSLDVKTLLNTPAFGEEDLKLYAEIGIIGLKSYGRAYRDIKERIPVTVGFNIPAFKLLDHLNLEVEWYGARYKNDYRKIITHFSPIPPGNRDYNRKDSTIAIRDAAGNVTGSKTVLSQSNRLVEDIAWEDPFDISNMKKDNWKWSLHASKMIHNQMRISAQVANDHFRPIGTTATKTYLTAFSTLDDWYWMMKLAYFF